ncbi:MAG: tetratricopeptide repeat protein [Gemmatimonas sp.]|nr:tetratricopeptide repeat protein [Gemmatimonas sp.]
MNSLPTQSTDELEKLERKHAENPEGRYFVPLANLYRRRGDVDQAMSLLRAGLARHPDYLSARIVLGRCLADCGECDAAETEFRYVLSLDSENLVALRTMGELAVAKGETSEGRSWYRELLGVDPMNEEARQALDSLEGPSEVATLGPFGDVQPPAAEESVPAGASTAFDEPIPSGEPSPSDVVDLPEEGGELGEPAPSPEPGFPPEPTFSAAPGIPAESTEEPPAHDASLAEIEDVASSAFDYGPTPEADELFVGSRDELEKGLREGREVVVTETIAELYTRQGFYDRAAEVYRELIRLRGGGDLLEERLREVERLAGRVPEAEEGEKEEEQASPELLVPDSPDAPIPVTDSSPWMSDQVVDEGLEDTETIPFLYPPHHQGPDVEPFLELEVEEDTFAESFVEGFPAIEVDEVGAGTGDAPSSQVPMAVEARSGETEVAEPAADALDTPADALDTAAEPPVSIGAESANGEWGPVAPAIEESETGLSKEEELTTVSASDELPNDELEPSTFAVEEPRSIQSYLADVFSWTPGATESKTPGGAREPEARAEPSAGPPSSAVAGETDLFPWEVPRDSPSSPTAAEVGSSDPSEESESRLEASDIETPDHSDSPSDSPSVSSEALPGDSSSETSGVEEEDDDLQSFQAWLRSLKR